jgi:hypothetical protein
MRRQKADQRIEDYEYNFQTAPDWWQIGECNIAT